MFGDITVRCRPLRLAFLITPSKSVLREAIQINSSLWGGPFNPIIPLYDRTPKAWKEMHRRGDSAKDRVLGYIRAFDPDLLANCTGEQLPPYLTALGRTVISVDEIWSNFRNDPSDWHPKYGVGVFELLNGIYKDFFEHTRRFPSKVMIPKVQREYALFWAAAIGEFSPDIQKAIEENFSEAIDIEKPRIDATNYESTFKPTTFVPRRIARYRLETERARQRHEDAYGFYMDVTKFADVVDFWNLRALGRAVVPIPRQFIGERKFVDFIRNFVRSQYRVHRQNPAITSGTSIVRSTSTMMAELEQLAKGLKLETLIPGSPNARVLMLQHWYPRIWDEWAMGRDGATPDHVTSNTEEHSFPNTDGTVTFNLIEPDFAPGRPTEGPRYANEIYPKFYGEGGTMLADVLPYDHGEEVLRVASGSVTREGEYRIGRTGLVNLVRWGRRAHWKVPVAEEVFLAWLKDKGFEAELSPCGRLAKQMHSQLDGWLGALTHEKLLHLFERMNRGGEDGRGASLGAVKNELKAIDSSGNLYQALVRRGVFKLGYKTQCVHCQRASWHSLDELATQLTCPLCHRKLDAIVAVDSANKGDWHLKTAGAFSVGNYAEGSYSVLLGLNFFERDMSLQTTSVLSFNAKHIQSGKELEADFALLWQDTVFGEPQDGILFAECKSYNKFEAKDFDRMRKLAKEFPGAILTFCTLRQKLEPGEIRELKRLTKAGMKWWKTERPLNPVLILTGQELFRFVGPPYCWDGLNIPEWAKRSGTILEICNATQAIYLGLPHWQETWRAAFERRRSRRDPHAR